MQWVVVLCAVIYWFMKAYTWTKKTLKYKKMYIWNHWRRRNAWKGSTLYPRLSQFIRILLRLAEHLMWRWRDTHAHIGLDSPTPCPHRASNKDKRKKNREIFTRRRISGQNVISVEIETKRNLMRLMLANVAKKCRRSTAPTEESWPRANYANKKLHLMHHKSPQRTCDFLAKKKKWKKKKTKNHSFAHTHTHTLRPLLHPNKYYKRLI